MTKSTKTIIPVSGKWNWISDEQPGGKKISLPVACWERDDETGYVIGLVATDESYGGDKNGSGGSRVAKLVEPPPIPGRYHRVDCDLYA